MSFGGGEEPRRGRGETPRAPHPARTGRPREGPYRVSPLLAVLLLAVLLLGLYVMSMVVLIGAGVAVAEERRARHQVPIHAPVPGAPQPVGGP